MKNAILFLVLLLSNLCYSQIDTIKPAYHVYHSEIKEYESWFYYQIEDSLPPAKYILQFDSIAPSFVSNSFESLTDEIIVRSIQSINVSPQKLKNIEIIQQIENLLTRLDTIYEFSLNLKEEEAILKAHYQSLLNGNKLRDRLEIIRKANEDIEKVRQAILLEDNKKKAVKEEITWLSNLNRRRQFKKYQSIYVMIYVKQSQKLHFRISKLYAKSNPESNHKEEDEAMVKHNFRREGFWLYGKLSLKNGQLIENALVSLYDQGEMIAQTISNANGFFQIKCRHQGPYNIVIEHSDIKSFKENKIIVKENKVNFYQFKLRSPSSVNAVEIISLAIPVLDIINDF